MYFLLSGTCRALRGANLTYEDKSVLFFKLITLIRTIKRLPLCIMKAEWN